MKRLSSVVIVLFAGLSLLGVGHARWTDSVAIDGRIETGELNWSFVSVSVMDTTPPPWFGGTATPVDWTCGDGFRNPWPGPGTKNVGWGEAILVDTDNDGRNDTVRVTMHNVYPSYFNSVNVYPYNDGTIPLKFDSVIINNETVIRKPPYPVVPLDLNGDTVDDIEILWGDNLGAQIHPGTNPLEMSFWFHVLCGAPQDAELEFDIQLDAVQYNMYVAP
ncbi:MAG: hypothetical protein KGZ40_02310 [Clostridiales bacterium]|nr:hypothetical protein [Clostridiales bacterium]